jgi:hypothetical protein
MIVIISITITFLSFLCLKLSIYITYPIITLVDISGQLDNNIKNSVQLQKKTKKNKNHDTNR